MKQGVSWSSILGRCAAAALIAVACCPFAFTLDPGPRSSADLTLPQQPRIASWSSPTAYRLGMVQPGPHLVRLPPVVDSSKTAPDKRAMDSSTYPIDLSGTIPSDARDQTTDRTPSDTDFVQEIDSLPEPVLGDSTDLGESATVSDLQTELDAASSDSLIVISQLGKPVWQTAPSVMLPTSQRAEQRIQQAFSLADKGATYSARKQLEAALETIAHALDSHYQLHAHTDCLARGLLAVQEAGDFLPRSGNPRSGLKPAVSSAKHNSTVLTEEERAELQPIEAMRRYFSFAQRNLVAATGGLPAASQAFYGLGKLCMAQAAQSPSLERISNLRAMLFFQAALQVNQDNYSAANELGVLLARDGRLDEARQILQLGVAVQPLPETWHNLAVVHERLGEFEQANRSRLEWQRATEATQRSSPGRVTAASGPSVYWVDKMTFERGTIPMASVGALR